MTGAAAGAAGPGAATSAAGIARDDHALDRASKPTLLEALRLTLLDAGTSFVERVDLFMLELEQAAHAAARIVALMVVAAVLGVTAWLGAWVLAAMLLLALGMPMLAVIAIVVVVNAGAAWYAWRRAHELFGTLGLPATRRQLRVAAGPSSRSSSGSGPTVAGAPRAPADAAIARGARSAEGAKA